MQLTGSNSCIFILFQKALSPLMTVLTLVVLRKWRFCKMRSGFVLRKVEKPQMRSKNFTMDGRCNARFPRKWRFCKMRSSFVSRKAEKPEMRRNANSVWGIACRDHGFSFQLQPAFEIIRSPPKPLKISRQTNTMKEPTVIKPTMTNPTRRI